MSTKGLDRHGEVVLPEGMRNADDFSEAMPLPLLWEHGPQVGHSRSIQVLKSKIKTRSTLAPTKTVAEEVRPLIEHGSLRAMSIGFIPFEGEERGDAFYWTDWALIEHSLVASPANTEAVFTVAKAAGYDTEPLAARFKGVVPYQDLPAHEDEDYRWSASAARKRVAAWASSDGSGDKDTIDWDRYRKAFFWYDTAEPENFGSYKLGYADVVGGTLKAIWRGVAAVVAVLQGARGGVDIPQADQDRIWGQCARYYKKWGKEMPEKTVAGLIWHEGEEDFVKMEAELDMCVERIERLTGAAQGVRDIVTHWQRAGGPLPTLEGDAIDGLAKARDYLDAVLLAYEADIESAKSRRAIEAALRALGKQ